MKKVNVLMVCLGNICRSPTAHGVLEALVQQQGLGDRVQVDSAGTSNWHIGAPPDSRSQEAALARGYDLSGQSARQVKLGDFTEFDYILAMDEANLRDLQALKPPSFKGHLGLFLSFARHSHFHEVPDPYHGGASGFELVLDLVEDAARGLLDHILREHAQA